MQQHLEAARQRQAQAGERAEALRGAARALGQRVADTRGAVSSEGRQQARRTELASADEQARERMAGLAKWVLLRSRAPQGVGGGPITSSTPCCYAFAAATKPVLLGPTRLCKLCTHS